MRLDFSEGSTPIKEIKQFVQFSKSTFTIQIFFFFSPYSCQGTAVENFQNIPLKDPYEMLFNEIKIRTLGFAFIIENIN